MVSLILVHCWPLHCFGLIVIFVWSIDRLSFFKDESIDCRFRMINQSIIVFCHQFFSSSLVNHFICLHCQAIAIVVIVAILLVSSILSFQYPLLLSSIRPLHIQLIVMVLPLFTGSDSFFIVSNLFVPKLKYSCKLFCVYTTSCFRFMFMHVARYVIRVHYLSVALSFKSFYKYSNY